ncbi:MAG: hypothetical protein K2X81_24205 [Candidatus Obscuribacterales bacterium]|nr:hypothetical protein [Candidatus Obscuribacterales bacterium]
MRNDIDAQTTVDAKKQTLGRNEALVLAKTAKEIYSMKGNKLIHIDMCENAPSEKELLEAMLGPTGNLRAPSIKLDDTLIIGFNEETFSKLFSSSAKIPAKVLK